MNDLNYSTDVEYEPKDKKKFQITRGMVILAILALIILITVIVIIVVKVNEKKKETYTLDDFNKLEERMVEEAPTYISQKQIVLTGEELVINLKDLLLENGGFIDSSKVKAAKVCEGYVIAVKQDTEKYSSYIKCGNMYTTSGYVSNLISNETTTTKENKDTTKPDLVLKGEKEIVINVGDKFEDPGVTATDNVDGDLSSSVKKTGSVDTSKAGTYTITYSVSDKAGNKSEVKRTVKVVQKATTTKTESTKKTTTKKNNVTTTKKVTTKRPTTPPVITLYGSRTITINTGDRYNDPGYSAVDSLGGNITSRVKVSGNVNTSVAGTYYITYSVTDNYGNKSSVSRTVVVKSSSIPLTGISISPNDFVLSVGQSKTLTVFYTPSNATDKTVSWSSDNPSVATVSGGVVYAKSRGSAIITVRGSNGKSATTRVTVK